MNLTTSIKKNSEIIIDRVQYTPIEKQSVVVIGVGRGGSWTILKLASSGIKNFILIDDDLVDESNLNVFDSVPYDYIDLGTPKPEAMKRILNESFPCVKVTTYNIRISPKISIEELDIAFGDSVMIVWAIDSSEGLVLADSPLILKRISVFQGLHAGIGGGHCCLYFPLLSPCHKHTLGLSSFDELQELSASESNITVQDIHAVTDCTVSVIKSILCSNFQPYFNTFDINRGNLLIIQRLADQRYRKLWLRPPIDDSCVYCGSQE
jgi:hypothetical protein